MFNNAFCVLLTGVIKSGLMYKKLICFISLFALSGALYSQTANKDEHIAFDGDFKFYTSSLFGHVAGNNAYLGMRENKDELDDCYTGFIETRFSTVSIKNFTLSCSFALGPYVDYGKDSSSVTSMNLSLGGGFYYHNKPSFLLTGFTFYLYPVYQISIYSPENYEPYLKWKIASDVGYTFTIFNSLTVYPYVRNIIGWNDKEFRYGFDCGIALGIYFPDDKSQYITGPVGE